MASLQISSRTSGSTLTPEQKRFNTLIRQIEQARQIVTAWQENLPLFRQTYVQVVLPLQNSFLAARRELVFALDSLLDQPGWTRTERATLRDLVFDTAAELLEADEDDAALKALFDKYGEVAFDTEKRQNLHVMKEMTETFTGLDLGDSADILTDEDLFRRISERMAEAAAANEAKRASRAARRRKTPAEQRREAEAQLATQSIREIYRKLASAVHPDREPDPVRRESKTAMMQKINQAYGANDLLTLLEMQLQIEQVDARQVAGASTQRLKHYNKVLTEQLAEVKAEIERMEHDFNIEFAVEPGSAMNPRKLGGLIDERTRLLRTELAEQQRDTRILSDRIATKRWLKEQRKAMREEQLYGELF